MNTITGIASIEKKIRRNKKDLLRGTRAIRLVQIGYRSRSRRLREAR
jgi:hypothetical protein